MSERWLIAFGFVADLLAIIAALGIGFSHTAVLVIVAMLAATGLIVAIGPLVNSTRLALTLPGRLYPLGYHAWRVSRAVIILLTAGILAYTVVRAAGRQTDEHHSSPALKRSEGPIADAAGSLALQVQPTSPYLTKSLHHETLES